MLGHIYKVLAFSLLYKGVFVAAVESPYLALSEANENLLRETVSRKELAKEVEERERIAKALAESEGRLRLFFDHAPAALAMLDREMRYLYVSRRWLSDYGLGGQDLRGRSHYEIFPELPEPWREVHRRALAGEATRAGVDSLRSPDGAIRWIRREVRPWFDLDGEIGGIVLSAEDVTERKWAQDRLNLLAQTASELLETDSPQRVVDRLCKDVMAFLDCDVFFNFLADEETGRLRLNAYAGIPEEEARRIEWLDYGVAVCGCAAMEACRIVAENIAATPDPRTELVKSYGVQAYACHPLMAQGRVLGNALLRHPEPHPVHGEELSLMKAVADHVSIAMERKISRRTPAGRDRPPTPRTAPRAIFSPR